MKKKQNNKLIYAALAVSLFLAIFTFASYYSSTYGSNYQTALSSELDDICKTPPDYTDEQWRTHMSHHPDRYSQCFR